MEEIPFVTENEGKVSTANLALEDFDVELVQREVEIKEIQSSSIEEITRDKVKSAYRELDKEVVVEDGGFFVEGLNGFPGHYVKFVLNTVGVEGLLKLADSTKCYFKDVVAYTEDGENINIFTNKEYGRLADEPRPIENDRAWSDLWKIFIPEGSDKTLGQFTDEEYEEYEKREISDSPFIEFGKWIERRR